MKSLNLFKNKTACGLDLGNGWAKIVRLGISKKGIALDRIGRIPWTKIDRTDQEEVGQRVKKFWQALALKNKFVISSMAGHAVIIKRIDLPFSGKNSIGETIQKQAKQHIPFDISDVYLDYQILDAEKTNNSLSAILVVSRKKMVHQFREVLEKAGLKVLVLDIDGFALVNCFEFNYPELLDDCSYLLDIGASHSVFCVYANNQLIFTRDIYFGGQQLNEKLAHLLNENQSEIEKLQLTGIKSFDSSKKTKIINALNETYNTLVEEIQLLVSYYQNSIKHPPVATKMYISGGGSLLADIDQHLANDLNMEVDYLNPWKKISFDYNEFDDKYLKNIGPQFAIAVGLALRAVI